MRCLLFIHYRYNVDINYYYISSVRAQRGILKHGIPSFSSRSNIVSGLFKQKQTIITRKDVERIVAAVKTTGSLARLPHIFPREILQLLSVVFDGIRFA